MIIMEIFCGNLNRKIQARYFWSNVLKMDDVEEEMIKKLNIKLIKGLKILNMNFYKIKSHAKINLALNVIGKNQSFHKIESIISFIHLYDEIL